MKLSAIGFLNRRIAKNMRLMLKMICMLCGAILTATIIMVALYAIPTTRSFENARKSANIFSDDVIANWADGKHYARIDNYTDAIMVNNAVYRPYDRTIENALLNPHASYSNKGMMGGLCRLLDRESGDLPENYARYWHGYLLYLIPLLNFFNIGEIRIIMMFVQFLLSMAVLYELGKIDALYMSFFAIVILFINPVTTILNFQYADIIIITLIYSIIILRNNEALCRKNGYLYLFAANGITVAFFDFLTYPVVAYGVPLILFFVLNRSKLINGIKQFLAYSATWAFGYAGMWCGKWIVAYILTGQNVIVDGATQLAYRMQGDPTGEKAEGTTYVYALKSVWWVVRNPVYGVLLIILLGMIGYFVYRGYRVTVNKEIIAYFVPIMLTGVTPFLWYLVVKNHSIVHPYMAFRDLAVSVWAGMTMIAMSLKQSKM